MGPSPTQSTRQLAAGAAVSLVGVALLAVPAYDVYEDVTELGWWVPVTLLENAVLFAVAAILVAGGVWLTRDDWTPESATTVATSTVLGTAATAAIFAWVVALQEYEMQSLKPVIIALNAVLVGAAGSFGVGVYRARSAARRRELATERNRLSGLFEATSDAVATVERTDDGFRVTGTNERFDATFADATDLIRDGAAAADTTPAALVDTDADSDPTSVELERDTAEGAREFLVQFVPFDTARGHTYLAIIATDITEQKALAREREANARLAAVHDVASDLQNVDDRESAVALVADAVDDLLDPDAVRVAVDADSDDAVTAGHAAIDPDADAAVGDRGHVAVAGDVADRETATLDLLATHLESTLARLDRERELAAEREELDFINRTLRHNLLNDIQVVRARLQTLEAEGETLDDHRDVLVDPLDRMADFVQTMRTYTKSLIEDDDHVLEPVDLQSTVGDVVAGTRDAYPDADVSVGDIPAVAVQADELLDPALDNVLKNAVEHNDKEPPRVHVDAERHGDWVTVRVADNGPGVPDDRKDSVFERGELGDHSSGSGFGLFLVGQTVESYGGGVEIVDNEPTGCVVRVTLPVAEH